MNSQESMADLDAIRFYGKYRGLVVNNIDPEQIARVMVQVPDVLGETFSSWAMPCVPVAGFLAGCYMVPPLGSQVWVEFEQGDPDYPIWAGGFWGTSAEIPGANAGPPGIPREQNIVLQTIGQNMIAASDAPPTEQGGGIVLRSTTGATIVVNDSGIYIDNGKGATISMIGTTVAINGTALTVT